MRQDIKKIRQVLKDYAQLKKDLELISLRTSPSFDSVPSHINQNGTEKKFIYHADLSNRLYRIETAIANIKDSKYRFIINKYIINKKYTREQLCERYSISIRGFNNMKNRALIEFAKNYGMKEILDKISKAPVYE